MTYSTKETIKEVFNSVSKGRTVTILDADGTSTIAYDVKDTDGKDVRLRINGNLRINGHPVEARDLFDPALRVREGKWKGYLEVSNQEGQRFFITPPRYSHGSETMNVYFPPELITSFRTAIESGRPELLTICTGRIKSEIDDILIQSGLEPELAHQVINVTSHGGILRMGDGSPEANVVDISEQDQHFLGDTYQELLPGAEFRTEIDYAIQEALSGFAQKHGVDVSIGDVKALMQEIGPEDAQGRNDMGCYVKRKDIGLEFGYPSLISGFAAMLADKGYEQSDDVNIKTAIEGCIYQAAFEKLDPLVEENERKNKRSEANEVFSLCEQKCQIELVPHGVNKGTGIRKLLTALRSQDRLNNAEGVVFAGDSFFNEKTPLNDAPGAFYVTGAKPDHNQATCFETRFIRDEFPNLKGTVVQVLHPEGNGEILQGDPASLTPKRSHIVPKDCPMQPAAVIHSPEPLAKEIADNMAAHKTALSVVPLHQVTWGEIKKMSRCAPPPQAGRGKTGTDD